jgi:hypothetical protein
MDEVTGTTLSVGSSSFVSPTIACESAAHRRGRGRYWRLAVEDLVHPDMVICPCSIRSNEGPCGRVYIVYFIPTCMYGSCCRGSTNVLRPVNKDYRNEDEG